MLSQKRRQVGDLNAICSYLLGGEKEDGSRLYSEVHSKSMMSNEHKSLQEELSSIWGENASTGRVELGPREGMEISFLG